VAQWGYPRGRRVLRALRPDHLPLAAELGHDHAVATCNGLQSLYARGSVLVTLLASIVVSACCRLAGFFVLWTHGIVPYDPVLTVTLLLGAPPPHRRSWR